MESKQTNMLTAVRNKFLRKAGINTARIRGNIDEQVLNARVLTPLCATDIAKEMFYTLDKSQFKQVQKRYYKEMAAAFHSVFNRYGILYSGLTDDEVILMGDYMDKIAGEVKKDLEILKWQIMGHLMDLPLKERETVWKLIFIMTICCYSHDMLERDLHTRFTELERISHIASLMVNEIMKSLFGKNAPDLIFTDDMFVRTLTVLFTKLTHITTEGIE